MRQVSINVKLVFCRRVHLFLVKSSAVRFQWRKKQAAMAIVIMFVRQRRHTIKLFDNPVAQFRNLPIAPPTCLHDSYVWENKICLQRQPYGQQFIRQSNINLINALNRYSKSLHYFVYLCTIQIYHKPNKNILGNQLANMINPFIAEYTSHGYLRYFNENCKQIN